MGTAQRRQREAKHRRQDILKAAKKVFWEHGYERATMPEVAAQAELAPGTLYLYFSAKAALYVELLIEGYDLLRQRLAVETQRDGRPPERASGLIEAFFGFAREFPEYFDIIFFVLQRENVGGWREKLSDEQLGRLADKELACKELAAMMLEEISFGDADRRRGIIEAIWSMLAGVVFYNRTKESFDEVSREAKNLLISAVFADCE